LLKWRKSKECLQTNKIFIEKNSNPFYFSLFTPVTRYSKCIQMIYFECIPLRKFSIFLSYNMCTLTYLPYSEGFILTSNRDERIDRKTIPPVAYSLDGNCVIFPKDTEASGSWIGLNVNRKISCLLNGAFSRHVKQEYHTKSRGLVLLESLTNPNFISFFKKSNFHQVEPFTLLHIDYSSELQLTKGVWDGGQYYLAELAADRPHILASALLYSEDERLLREQWFENFLNDYPVYNPTDIFHFHTSRHTDDESSNILVSRMNGYVRTVSISQIIHTVQNTHFNYFDLLTNESHSLKVDKGICDYHSKS